MSNQLLQKLEEKIDSAIEVIELLHMQIEELQAVNKDLLAENAALKNRQSQWEQNLTSLLRKLEEADLNPTMDSDKIDFYEKEDAIA